MTVILAALTFFVLLLSVPSSLREAYARDGFYVFSREFIEDIPRRLAGPGRLRFVLQPLVAIILGIQGGQADARAGRPPYLAGILFHRELRGELTRTAFAAILNLLLLGILLDSISQWLILGASYPGAALVVGPVLIVTPYVIARSLANWKARPRS